MCCGGGTIQPSRWPYGVWPMQMHVGHGTVDGQTVAKPLLRFVRGWTTALAVRARNSVTLHKKLGHTLTMVEHWIKKCEERSNYKRLTSEYGVKSIDMPRIHSMTW